MSQAAADFAAILAQIPGQPLQELERFELRLQQLRQGKTPIPEVVASNSQPLVGVDWDVLICGGTLGIMLGAALVRRGWRVALLERGRLQGRPQEWNTSRKELQVLLDLELLNEAELAAAIVTEYNPARVAIRGGAEVWVRDVLNIGVDPVYLLAVLKQVFLQAGGKLLELTGFEQVIVQPNGVMVRAGGQQQLTGRLLLDAMGYFSPVAAQARQGQQPDGICMVVGSCAQGIPENSTGDLFVSFTPIQDHCQAFWEAFPARDGRTTYLFTYTDPRSPAPTLTSLLNSYLTLLPEYQQVTFGQLQFQRLLSGIFPSYRQPLRLPWDRILAVGDSSGNQSPLSFGGFGAMLRHLQRLSTGIGSALEADCLSCRDLALLQPYQPNLAVTWLFQQTMRVPPAADCNLAPEQINQLLAAVFTTMNELGPQVLLPFLQDVVQFPALTQTLLRVGWQHPGLVARIVTQVGPLALLAWLPHYLNLGLYSCLHTATPPLQWLDRLSPQKRYFWQQQLQIWKYGSGGDHRL